MKHECAGSENNQQATSACEKYNTITPYSNEHLFDLLPFPTQDANKYSRGRAIVVAGSAKYLGAACLCVASASRTGAGYVQAFCNAQCVPAVQAFMPSAVVSAWGEALNSANGQVTSKRIANVQNINAKREVHNFFKILANISSAPEKPVAIVLGPGFDAHDDECIKITHEVLEVATENNTPILIDAGALSILSTDWGIKLLREYAHTGIADPSSNDNNTAILTPHAGEARRLACALDIDLSVCAQEPESLAVALCKELKAVVCLKGPNTYIAIPNNTYALVSNNAHAQPAKIAKKPVANQMPKSAYEDNVRTASANVYNNVSIASSACALYTMADGTADPNTMVDVMPELYVMKDGTPALAKAGTGDVLAGMIGGLLAQGMSPADAAILGTTLHACAGACAERDLTSICVAPEDVISHIPYAIKEISENMR